ncbi:hypothetical protein HWV62_45340 [Athelia sp. TMB]|nr:hypothetical protein HWV62_45340 [Athelia sp. TMB]
MTLFSDNRACRERARAAYTYAQLLFQTNLLIQSQNVCVPFNSLAADLVDASAWAGYRHDEDSFLACGEEVTPGRTISSAATPHPVVDGRVPHLIRGARSGDEVDLAKTRMADSKADAWTGSQQPARREGRVEIAGRTEQNADVNPKRTNSVCSWGTIGDSIARHPGVIRGGNRSGLVRSREVMPGVYATAAW